jgi:hypothetical protein
MLHSCEDGQMPVHFPSTCPSYHCSSLSLRYFYTVYASAKSHSSTVTIASGYWLDNIVQMGGGVSLSRGKEAGA